MSPFDYTQQRAKRQKTERKLMLNGSMDRDWAAAESDFLDVVLNKLVSLYDYLQFSLVCKSWYCVALRNKRQRSIITSNVPQLPMLIVPSKDEIEKKHCLYDLRNNEAQDVDFKIRYNQRCCGSSHGWLFVLEETMNITLFNPFSGSVIRLPPITRDFFPLDYPGDIINKAILTKDPSLYPNDYMVVVIYGRIKGLCIMKANDKTWTYLSSKGQNNFGDVNVYNNALYVLEGSLRLWKVEEVDNRDDGNSSFHLKMVTPSLDLDPFVGQVYVVESSKRELFLVKRGLKTKSGPPNCNTISHAMTKYFYVYKLTQVGEDGMQKHVKVKSLDDDAMFIGDNRSMCVSTKDFPHCLPNRIYYTDNCLMFIIHFLNGPRDAGIFSLEDRSFGTHYITDPAHRNLPPPIWIVPTICTKNFEN